MDADFLNKLRSLGLEYYGRYYGIYAGVVTDNKDPQSQGRIKVKVPALGRDDEIGLFAYPVSPFAGNRIGFFFPPEVGDTVWVSFQGGNPTLPIYLGGWWGNPSKSTTGSDVPPETTLRGRAPKIRELRTTSGNRIVFDDDGEGITIQTAGGSIVRVKDSDGKVEIQATDVTVKASRDAKVEGNNVDVTAANVSITGQTVKVNNGTKFAAAIADLTTGGLGPHSIVGPAGGVPITRPLIT